MQINDVITPPSIVRLQRHVADGWKEWHVDEYTQIKIEIESGIMLWRYKTPDVDW